MGPGPYEHGPPQGDLLTNLERLGVNASDVNNVVTTHCHGDHIGWNMQGTGASASTTFPNATYHVAKSDWTFYSDPAKQNDVFDAQVAPLNSTGQRNLVLAEVELMDGVTLLPTNGHSPGHQCVLVQSGGENRSAHRRPIPQHRSDQRTTLVPSVRLAHRSIHRVAPMATVARNFRELDCSFRTFADWNKHRQGGRRGR